MNTLVILHGWKSSSQRWQRIKEILEEKGLKVFVPDLPGFKNENELKQVWTLDDYLAWTERFIEKVAPQPFFLLGHSFGGRISIKYAAKYPERLKGLILVSAAGVTRRPKFKIALFAFLGKIAKLIFAIEPLGFLEPVVRKIAYFLLGVKDYRFLEGRIMKETFKRVIGEDLKSFLPLIDVPTLIVWGREDKTTPLTDGYLMNKQIKQSRMEILEGVGHLPHLKKPELLAEKIWQFVNSQRQ
jgi:pimeloyl-ACP methyl ester carboxylesterase